MWDLDSYINSILQHAQEAADAEIRRNIIEIFGSIKAFEKVADQYVLEYQQPMPLFGAANFHQPDDEEVRFRIETIWRIRKKTEEELAEDKKEDDVSTPDL